MQFISAKRTQQLLIRLFLSVERGHIDLVRGRQVCFFGLDNRMQLQLVAAGVLCEHVLLD